MVNSIIERSSPGPDEIDSSSMNIDDFNASINDEDLQNTITYSVNGEDNMEVDEDDDDDEDDEDDEDDGDEEDEEEEDEEQSEHDSDDDSDASDESIDTGPYSKYAEEKGVDPFSHVMMEDPGLIEVKFVRDPGFEDTIPRATLDSITESIQAMIKDRPKPAEGREIEVVYKHSNNQWYGVRLSDSQPMPWNICIHGGHFEVGPEDVYNIASDQPSSAYPFFNYEKDTLFLYYPSCIRKDERHLGDMVTAFTKAVSFLEHRQKDEASPKLKHLAISWCSFVGFPNPVLDIFSSLTDLETLTLKAHDHWDDKDVEDPEIKSYILHTTACNLDRDRWDFHITIEDENGHEVTGEYAI